MHRHCYVALCGVSVMALICAGCSDLGGLAIGTSFSNSMQGRSSGRPYYSRSQELDDYEVSRIRIPQTFDCAVFSQDGNFVICGTEPISVWDIRTGSKVRDFKEKWSPRYLALSGDGRLAVSDGRNRTVIVWDVESGNALRQLNGHSGYVSSVACSPDGRHVLTASADMTVRLWDADSGKELRQLEARCEESRPVHHISFSPDGTRALIESPIDRTARLWEFETGQELRLLEKIKYANGRFPAFAPDGIHAAFPAYKGISLCDLVEDKEVRHFNGLGGSIYSVAFSPDGNRLVVGSDTTIYLWDTKTGKLLRRFSGHCYHVSAVGFSFAGRQVYSAAGNPDNTVSVWNAVR